MTLPTGVWRLGREIGSVYLAPVESLHPRRGQLLIILQAPGSGAWPMLWRQGHGRG